MLSESRFSAFISYSHADRGWADWLHRTLESYRLPGQRGRSLAPVFLDRAELAASDDLESDIADALNRAQTLIVVCSPTAARSSRVASEIERFQAIPGRRILTLVVAGRPNSIARQGEESEECLPAPLRRDTDNSVREGLAADVRQGRGGKREALLKLVAGILDLELDVLRRRELQRQRRRWLAVTGVTAAGMAVTTGLAIYAWGARSEALHAEARARIEADTATQVTSFLVDTFDVVRPKERDGNRVLARELLDNAARELRTGSIENKAVRARMLETVGRVYRQIGLLEEARPLLAESLALRKSLPDVDPVEVASALQQMAALEIAADQHEVAEREAREALAMLAQSTDVRAPALRADLLLTLGNVHIRGNRFKEADAVLAEALEIRSKEYGEHSAESAQVRFRAATSWREQGKYDQALKALNDGLADLRTLYAGMHVDIARGLHELSLLYEERGDYVAGERVAKEALRAAEGLYGADNPEIGGYVEMAAIAAGQLDRVDEAIAGFRRVLSLRTAAFGTGHTRTGYAHYNLGYALGDGGKYKDAMVHLRESQRIWEASLGPQHPDVAYALDAQAQFLRKQGRLAEAGPLVQQALVINEAANGPDHSTTARSVLNLANWLRDSGRYAEARSLYARAEKIRVVLFGADSPHVKQVQEARAELEQRSRTVRTATH
jgi:tetratricopeptide (TPR) repeat protein